MSIPLLDLTRDTALLDQLEEAVRRVVRSGVYIGGAELESFEHELADYLGVTDAVGLSSGTDALLAALMALDVGPGDAVALPVYTFFATAGVVHRLGARPVLVDVEPEHQNIDPAALERALDGNPDVKAAFIVHLFGAGAAMDRIEPLLAARGIPLIEDAAQAIGTRIDGRMAGSRGWCGCFSAFPSKNLSAAGDAGFLSTDDAELAARMRRMRNHGQTGVYEHEFVGGNFRLDALQAAVLRVKLRHIEAATENRRANAARYRELFAQVGLTEVVTLPTDIPDRHTYHQFSIRLEPTLRDAVRDGLRQRGIGCAVYYPLPLHLQPCFASLGHARGDFPVAEQLCASNLALPIFPELRPDEQERVVAAIGEVVAQSA